MRPRPRQLRLLVATVVLLTAIWSTPSGAQPDEDAGVALSASVQIVGPDAATGTRPVTFGCVADGEPAERTVEARHGEHVSFDSAEVGVPASAATDCWISIAGPADRTAAIAIRAGGPVWHTSGTAEVRFSIAAHDPTAGFLSNHKVWFWSGQRVADACALDEQLLSGRSSFVELSQGITYGDRLATGDAVMALRLGAEGIATAATTSGAPSLEAMASPAGELVGLADELWELLAPEGIFLVYVDPDTHQQIQAAAAAVLERFDLIEAARALSCAEPSEPVVVTPAFTG